MNSVPRTTTLIGGWLLCLAGLLGLLPTILSWIPAADWASSLFRSGPAQAITILALLAACLILAIGLRGETRITGSSLAGRSALIALALAYPIQSFVSFALVSQVGAGSFPVIWIGTALDVVHVAAVLVAAVAVVRAHILGGFARWTLLAYGLALAVVLALVAALSSVPTASVTFFVVVLDGMAAIPPALLVATGLSYVLHGRKDAVTGQLKAVHAKWLLSTSVH